MKRIAFEMAILLVTFYSLAFGERFSTTEVRTYQICRTGKVAVENVNGTIKVESWDKDEVSVEITKTVIADDSEKADDCFRMLDIEIRSDEDHLVIDTHYPEGRNESHGFFDRNSNSEHGNGMVDYVLKVPAGVSLEISSKNGKVEVYSVYGGVQVRSVNGRLELHNVSGRVNSSTTNGNIFASLNSKSTIVGIHLSTTNGSITLLCPDSVNADVSGSTANGDIDSDFPVTINGGFLGKSLVGRINNGGIEIHLTAVNGSIYLRKR